MGNSSSIVLDRAGRHGAEAQELIGDVLTTYEEFGAMKSLAFSKKVREENDLSAITSRRFLAEGSVVRCGVKADAQELARYINHTFDALASHHVADAVASVLSFTLKSLLSQRSPRPREFSEYFIVVGELGAPYRIDVNLNVCSFASEHAKELIDNVVIVSLVLSSVDVSRLDDNILGSLVQSCYWAAPRKTQQSVLEKFRLVKLNAKLGAYGKELNADASYAFSEATLVN